MQKYWMKKHLIKRLSLKVLLKALLLLIGTTAFGAPQPLEHPHGPIIISVLVRHLPLWHYEISNTVLGRFSPTRPLHPLDLKAAQESTSLIRMITRTTTKAQVVPIVVAKPIEAVTSARLAQALQSALQENSQIIINPWSAPDSNPALAAVVQKINQKKILLIHTAQMDAPYPLRPMALKELYPHALGGSIIVGSIQKADDLNTRSNFGPELDLVLMRSLDDEAFFQETGRPFEPDLAAAKLAGALVSYYPFIQTLQTIQNDFPKHIRALIRAATRPLPLHPALLYSLQQRDHLGFGVFEAKRLQELLLNPPTFPTYQLYANPSLDRIEMDLNSENNLPEIQTRWKCNNQQGAQRFSNSLSEGRARISFQLYPQAKGCQFEVRLLPSQKNGKSLLLEFAQEDVRLARIRQWREEEIKPALNTLLKPFEELK